MFYRDGEWIYSIIDDKLYLKSPCWDSPSMQRDLLQQIDREDVERVYRKTYQTGSKALFFAQNKDQNETWVPLIEKAYAKAHGDFACLAGGWIGEALEDLSGGVTTELLASDIFDTDAFWTHELSRVNQEFLFGCSTGLLDGGYGERDGISEGHAYVVMEARTLRNGTRLCKLRNPWGKVKKGNWEGAWSDGSKEWTTEVKEELGHTFGSDSTFWISYEDLLRKYQHFDRTRLFRDTDWRSCQRWIGVEVPWKPQYNEKFHIKLTKDSPLVLVLSQLDTRYFKGLQGQYNFRLQFRVHEEGRPGAEEYIVRSHGNYLMDRSVSVELPSVGPGNYVVFISILGERDTRVLSTEDVIKREAKGREENEKLAQVGQAYDLAHSKAASHLERLAKVRHRAESKKASQSRCKERRRNWEKRQTGRAISQKQKAKDDAKKARLKAEKKAKAEAEAAEKAEREAADKAEADKKKAAATEKAAQEERQRQRQRQLAEATCQPKDSGVQTDAKVSNKEEASQTEVEADSASTTSASSSSTGTPQYTPQDTPSSQAAQPVENNSNEERVRVPPGTTTTTATTQQITLSGGPPPPPPSSSPCSPQQHQHHHHQPPIELKLHCCSCDCACKKPAPPPKADESDGYSSDSPIEDYEQLYDEDDLTPTLRLANASPVTPASASKANGGNSPDSDDEDVPDPWNAIAVIGFRVYSKDEDLELRVIMEGGALEQDGMGSLGEADLDNAVSNAAGQRSRQQQEKEKEGEKKEGTKEDEEGKDEEGGHDTEKKNQQQEVSSKREIPELRVTTTTTTTTSSNQSQGVVSSGGDKQSQQQQQQQAGGQQHQQQQHEAKSAPIAGMAAYRTIIERKTSEFDRVMGKVNNNTNKKTMTTTTATSSSGSVAAPTVVQDDVIVEQPTPSSSCQDNNHNNKVIPAAAAQKMGSAGGDVGYFSDAHDTPTPESPLERKTREVLFLRHQIQRGYLTPLVDSSDDDDNDDEQEENREEEETAAAAGGEKEKTRKSGGGRRRRRRRTEELANLLTQLEGWGELEARVLRATKIHKVMKALVKRADSLDLELDLGLDDGQLEEEASGRRGSGGSTIRARACALLDEYELTLLVGDEEEV